MPQPVYPRTGGGNHLIQLTPTRLIGLSPHGRGKLGWAVSVYFVGRSIPARAGETESVGIARTPAQVYPRTGGGNQ